MKNSNPKLYISSDISSEKYSIANQVERYQHQKKTNCQQTLNIEKLYDPCNLKNKRVLITGANRGLGLALTKAVIKAGAIAVAVTRTKSSSAFDGMKVEQISGIDVTLDENVSILTKKLKVPVDIVINNAGYFYGPVERITENTLNFEEIKKMIDICAIGPLITNALYQAQLINKGGKIVIITSQAGSISWRTHQNPNGDNYTHGHHMSRSATNMMAKLLSFEMKNHGFPVALLHPGFNKTTMTKKYESIWDVEGAVDPEIGAIVLHTINQVNMENSGDFINCEDGLLIPW